MEKEMFRHLRGYVLDPSFSTRLDTMSINEIVYSVRWEELQKGPVGQYFEVVDYDPASNCFYDPVDLNSREALSEGGLALSQGNPQFHQQFVYLVAMNTLDHFEQSMGRKIIWNPRKLESSTSSGDPTEFSSYIPRLRLYPHAFRDANAYYDPEKRAVLFGYFEAAPQVQGSNLPGGVIFSCLSPDIVAHELTHAILDSIHPRFIEDTNPDVPAFHEAFADIVALLQRFTITQLVQQQIATTRGDLTEFSFLGELATQFGDALQGNRGALRGAIGKIGKDGVWRKLEPDPTAYHTEFEPHTRGAILVATIFDAFIRLYNVTTADLLRIASQGSGVLNPGAIHPDLTKRLAAAACEIAEHLLHVCIRALDYCPPMDITFGEYLRALITADLDISPRDVAGYRIALIEAFRSRGIFPEHVNTLSVESLCWNRPDMLSPEENDLLGEIADYLKGKVSPVIDLSLLEDGEDHREEIYNAMQGIQSELHGIMTGKKSDSFKKRITWPDGFMAKLGLAEGPITFQYNGQTITSKEPKLQVYKVRPVYRVGRENKILEQVLVTFNQTIHFEGGDFDGAVFRGGCTMILNISHNYKPEYIIFKNIHSNTRFERQMDYQTGNSGAFSALANSMYDDDKGFNAVPFSHLHFHESN
jgi:hypothetical protein